MKKKNPPEKPRPLPKVKTRTWTGCYAKKWESFDIPESVFSHPAKFAPALLERIYRHGLKIGAFRPGDVIGDPFGGVFMGGYMARRFGLSWIGQELERKFVIIGRRLLRYQNKRDEVFRYNLSREIWKEAPPALLLQGDSRFFAANVAGIVTSPPYADSLKHYQDGIDWEKVKQNDKGGRHQAPGRSCHSTYGKADGQIGRLLEGEFGAVITSPPFGPISGGAQGIAITGTQVRPDGSGGSGTLYLGASGDRQDANLEKLPEGNVDHIITSPPFGGAVGGGQTTKCGQTGATFQGASGDRQDANLEKLPEGDLDHIVTSPPHSNTELTSGRNFKSNKCPDSSEARLNGHDGYGSNEGQIARLPSGDVGGIVTSPPFEDNCRGHVGADRFKDADKFATIMAKESGGHANTVEARKAQLERDSKKTYGDAEGQIGKENGEGNYLLDA